jgi:hypothetical protein
VDEVRIHRCCRQRSNLRRIGHLGAHDEERIDRVDGAEPNEGIESTRERGNDGTADRRRRTTLEPIEKGIGNAHAAFAEARGASGIDSFVSNVPIRQMEERPQATKRDRGMRWDDDGPHFADERSAFASQNPVPESIAQTIERLFGIAPRLSQRQKLREKVVLEQAQVEVTKDRKRRPSSDRPCACLRILFFARDRLERVDRGPRRRKSPTRDRVRLLRAPSCEFA